MSFTRVACKYANVYLDKKDKYEQCYVELGKQNMFKTGRIDCKPKPGSFKYLTTKVEHHPSIGFNGERTMKYFKDDFGMNPREVAALMGTHTIGSFNPIVTQ